VKLAFVALVLKLGGEMEFQVAQNLGIYEAKKFETFAVSTCAYTVALLGRNSKRDF
jgi:hypothetical protein